MSLSQKRQPGRTAMTNKILIVDGSMEFREFLVKYFNERDFDAQCVDSYENAFKAFQSREYDMAIIDFFIDGKTADGLCAWLSENRGNLTPFIITNEHQSLSNEIAIRSYSPWFYFIKPFNIEDLYAVVLKIMERKNREELKQMNALSNGVRMNTIRPLQPFIEKNNNHET
jgi:DNA-binding response OmpR family regulator